MASGEKAEGRLDANRVRVWDLPTRLFHWLLVILIVVNFYTGWTGGLREMELHMLSGYGILTLVLFRVGWGFVGTRYARFSDFVRGPRAVLVYFRSMAQPSSRPHLGHNPAGGWSVLLMLFALAVQASTGLFASDDIFTEGPLADKVSSATSGTLTAIHEITSNIVIALVAIHLVAVFGYLLFKRDNLISPMVTGRKSWAEPSGASPGGNPGAAHGGAATGVGAVGREALALLVLLAAVVLVWFLVTL